MIAELFAIQDFSAMQYTDMLYHGIAIVFTDILIFCHIMVPCFGKGDILHVYVIFSDVLQYRDVPQLPLTISCMQSMKWYNDMQCF